MKKLLFILFVLISSLSVSAQETEWMFGFNGVTSGQSAVCRGIDGNIIFANSFNSMSNGSFQFKGSNITVANSTTASNLMLSSITTDSSLVWVFSTDVATNQGIIPLDITTDEAGNIYLQVVYIGSITLSPNIHLSYNYGTIRRNALIKFNKNGTLLWAREYGGTTVNPYDQDLHKIGYSGGRIFISHLLVGVMEYAGSAQTYSATDARNYAIAVYDSSGKFLWVKQYGSTSVEGAGRRDLKATYSSVYSTVYFDKEYIHSSDTLKEGNYLLQLDTSGNLTNYVRVQSVKPLNVGGLSGIKFDVDSHSGSVYMSFPFGDSVEILSHKEISKTNSANNMSFCLLKLNRQLDSIAWCKCLDSTSQGFLNPAFGLLLDNNNIYFGGGQSSQNVYFNNNLFSPKNFFPSLYPSMIFIAKTDTLGNLLWGFTNDNTSRNPNIGDITVDTIGSLYLAGDFSGQLRLFDDSLVTTSVQEAFLAKITDYSITRGEVSAGPYCAGDSMDIPYTKKGEYNPDNWFVAQLSDENGNFDDTSKVRELGRVKSTEDSTIRGELPLFQVSSSANYRIRVISTSPPVQSFYKRDSLRLLIYSRDKADPGPPELACFGDSFQLHTYGGTVWEWSPAYLMDDSTSRTPKVLTLQDTVFRIVISDTSGCGEPDTAFKRIIIRDNPKVEITDSFKVCLDEEVALNTSFKNGDSLGYNWTWYNVVRANDWREIASDSFALVDTLLYRHNTTATRRLAIVLGDNCSIIKDTAEFVVTLKPIKIKGEISTLDSLQCDGSLVELFGNISGGDSATYSWEWFEIDEQNIPVFLDSGKGKFADTIGVQLNKSIFDSRKFAFVTKDECLPYIDSSFIELKIDRRVPEAVVFPRDTAICPSTSAEITAQISDGSGKGFRWKWIDEKGNILSQDSGNVSEIKTIIKPVFNNQDSQRFWFIVEDICSPESDTQEFVISPLPPLEISSLYSDNILLTESNGMLSGVEACFGAHLNFSALGAGGTNQNYQWNWKIFNPDNNVMLNSFQHLPDGNSDSLTDYEPSELLRKLLVSLTLQDGCMEKGDSVSFEVIIREPLKAQILNFAHKSANDTSVCSGSELKFFAKGTGGVEEDYEFTWLLDNEEISKGDSIEINSKDFKNLDAVLTLILKDDCSVLADTQRINLHTLPELKAEFSAPDTICLGEGISLAAQGSGGIENQYQFTWLHKKDNGTLEIIKNAETLDLNSKELVAPDKFNQFNSREILLVLRDNCSSPNDTFSKKIIIRPELSLTLSSSTICADPNATLTANPKGGNPNSYSINWFDKNGNPLGNDLTQTVSPEGFDKFSATLTDNCSSERATAEIKVDRVPELLTLENTPSEGCEPLPVDFTLQTNYPDKYGFTLSFGNGDSTHTFEIPPTLHYTYPHAGHFIPLLTLITAGGCQAQVSGQAIDVYPKPFADFGYQPEEPDMDNPLVSFQNRSTGAVSYQWDIAPFGTFTDENPIVTYTDSGYHNVRLIAVSKHGCRDTSDSRLYIKTNYRVFFPTAFSPNGDGLNDTFKPLVRGFSELDFKVYSRWGELLFHSSSDEAWDGSSNGVQVPDGVYAFTLRVVNVFGETQFFTGTVTLIK